MCRRTDGSKCPQTFATSAYVIADNKLALNAGWDESILKAEIDSLKESDFDLSLTGFS